MAELGQVIIDGTEVLTKRIPNSISLNAGAELFRAFVTLFPHESDVSMCINMRLPVWYHSAVLKSIADLKTKLANQGKKYTAEALSYRDKIAELTLGFIKDDSVV